MKPSLSALVARENEDVSKRAKELFARNANLAPAEQDELHALWDYGKRLAIIQVLLAVAEPGARRSPAELDALGDVFRRGVVRHGSATDDNVAASSMVVVSEDDGGGVSLRMGREGHPLGQLLLGALDVIGTAEFFAAHLGSLNELRGLTPELWEAAYRVLMLTTDVLLARPRHATSPSAV